MPRVKLKLIFGGLCMFVQKQKVEPKGLYVLMPQGHLHRFLRHRVDHCPMLITYRDAQDAKQKVSSFEGEVKAFPTLIAGQPTKLPPEMLRISHYAGKAVKPGHFTSVDLPRDGLLARVRIPANAELTVIGVGHLLVPPRKECGTFTGQVMATFEAETPIEIGGRALLPEPDGSYEARIFNIPMAHLDGVHRKAKRGQKVKHAQSYYGLLAGNNADDPKGPDIYVDSPDCPDGEDEAPMDCLSPGEIIEMKRYVNAEGIDPLNCTVGHGCDDPEYPDC